MGTVGQAFDLSINFLKNSGYLKGTSTYGEISWSRGGEPMGAINFRVCVNDMSIQFLYTVTDHTTGEIQHMDYKVTLLKSWCHFGGYRYWFRCNYCQKKVGVLYIKGYARCRKCSRLHYASQHAGRLERSIGSKGYLYMLDDERRSMRVKYYAGRPTKRYLRYLRREAKAEKGFEKMMFI